MKIRLPCFLGRLPTKYALPRDLILRYSGEIFFQFTLLGLKGDEYRERTSEISIELFFSFHLQSGFCFGIFVVAGVFSCVYLGTVGRAGLLLAELN